MARIPYADESGAEIKALVERIRAERGGRISNLLSRFVEALEIDPEMSIAGLSFG